MIDGNLRDIAEDIELDKNLKHDIFVVVDRIVVKKGSAHAYLIHLKQRYAWLKAGCSLM